LELAPRLLVQTEYQAIKLIDKADRLVMFKCLKFLWNQLWCVRTFVSVWKQEDRVVIPKAGKKDYHETTAYRTVAITSVVGKRFEHITARRLALVLADLQFDPLQFAYLRNRSTTEAILVLTELIKKSSIEGYKTGAVFFDFADAFGSVDRSCLIYKIGHHFNISGRLLLHINSFLSNRSARIRFNGEQGSWIESEWGTSAGTKLGPLLFITYLHDLRDLLTTLSRSLPAVTAKRLKEHCSNRLMMWWTGRGNGAWCSIVRRQNVCCLEAAKVTT